MHRPNTLHRDLQQILGLLNESGISSECWPKPIHIKYSFFVNVIIKLSVYAISYIHLVICNQQQSLLSYIKKVFRWVWCSMLCIFQIWGKGSAGMRSELGIRKCPAELRNRFSIRREKVGSKWLYMNSYSSPSLRSQTYSSDIFSTVYNQYLVYKYTKTKQKKPHKATVQLKQEQKVVISTNRFAGLQRDLLKKRR